MSGCHWIEVICLTIRVIVVAVDHYLEVLKARRRLTRR